MNSCFKNKRLLILGAMEMHVPLIKRANELGIYTITCDYYSDIPGHKIANEAHVVSTTNLDAVLQIAIDSHIDGIMTYNSDPAAATVAYVAEKLHLPGNSYLSVKTMSEKDLFRNFLLTNNLNVPHFVEFRQDNLIEENKIEHLTYPLIVKPVDSSGSKGVSVVNDFKDLKKRSLLAFSFSRCKRVIVEEYIEAQGNQLHGDGFIKDGQLVFLHLGDHHFDFKINNLVPYSTTYPTEHSDKVLNMAHEEIQRFISLVGFKNGGINVELRLSAQNGKIYIIDIGARNGGNYTPKLIEYATGFNFLDAALQFALGFDPVVYFEKNKENYFSYLILHSSKSGVLESLEIDNELKTRIVEEHIYKKIGDQITAFEGANSAIGVLIMKYENREVMNSIVSHFDQLYKANIL